MEFKHTVLPIYVKHKYIIYLFETIVSKDWLSSSVFLVRNIWSVISHGFNYPSGYIKLDFLL